MTANTTVSINTPVTPNLPSIPDGIQDPKVKEFLSGLIQALTDHGRNIYKDILFITQNANIT
jgi:hypothetical protein